jgi:hypothetical protein
MGQDGGHKDQGRGAQGDRGILAHGIQDLAGPPVVLHAAGPIDESDGRARRR